MVVTGFFAQWLYFVYFRYPLASTSVLILIAFSQTLIFWHYDYLWMPWKFWIILNFKSMMLKYIHVHTLFFLFISSTSACSCTFLHIHTSYTKAISLWPLCLTFIILRKPSVVAVYIWTLCISQQPVHTHWRWILYYCFYMFYYTLML